MFLFLEDIISCIELTLVAYVDLNTFSILFIDEVNKASTSRIIKLPVIQQELMMQEFIRNTTCKRFKRVFSDKEWNIDTFYTELHRFQLIDEWYQFRHEYCSNIAEEWCYLNNIPFTKKEKR